MHSTCPSKCQHPIGLLGDDAFGSADISKWQFAVADVGTTVEPAERVDAEAVFEEFARGQGYEADPTVRRAIELAAMAAATDYFRGMGYEVHDHSTGHPYDLYCQAAGGELHVEVKGTRSTGGEVVLTANEVEFARQHRDRMGLFVLHSVEVIDGPTGPTARGGVARVLLPWDVNGGSLRPISYRYGLPE